MNQHGCGLARKGHGEVVNVCGRKFTLTQKVRIYKNMNKIIFHFQKFFTLLILPYKLLKKGVNQQL